MSNYQIAIVGRPNVGKSTFFNRLLKQQKAIVGSEEGITRDRIYGEVEWSGHILTFIDTGGYIHEDVDDFNSAVRDQALADFWIALLHLGMKVGDRFAPHAKIS